MKFTSLKFALAAIVLATFAACNPEKTSDIVTEPIAKKIPHTLEIHGQQRTDPYFWLKDRENPEVIKHLEAENAYREYVMKGTEDFQEKLYSEIRGRIKEDDQSVPSLLNGFYYYSRYEKGKEYPIYCRKKSLDSNEEEILLDVNQMAEGHDYYQVGSIAVSPNNKLLAFGVDTLSRRIYTLYFKNLETGEILSDTIPNTVGYGTWAADNKTFFYGRQDLQTLRSDKIMRHTLGAPVADDTMVYQETDDTFSTFVRKSKSREYIIIHNGSTTTDEFLYLKADDPNGQFRAIHPRQRGLEYQVEPYEGNWYIITNFNGATNFKLVKAPIGNSELSQWKDVIPHRENVFLEGFEIFKDYLVLEEREQGLTNLKFRSWDGEHTGAIPVKEETYAMYSGANNEFDTHWLRFHYTSLTAPSSVREYNLRTGEERILKEQEIPGGYNAEEYQAERVWATANDGAKVPISLVYKKSLKRDAGNPLLLYAYGSYGATMDASFSVARLSLLDRGFVFAIAHVRGGSYLGRPWYEDGKMLKKMNTFTDFIACAEYLIENKYTHQNKLFAQGGSAGGLLMGVIANLRPDLWRGVIADVPFVDVVTTMLDESIPLTTGEYDEWGNPNEKAYYDYMLSYSPYDNVEKKDYPAMIVMTGLHDSQVQYWEPAKWVARLREMRTDPSKPLVMYCNMKAGHGGASGRFEAIRDIAMEYAFIFDLIGITE